MNEILQLTAVDFPSLFISVFIILMGIKSIVSILEWLFDKLGLETKFMRKKREDHELLDELGDGSYAQFSVHLETDAQSAYDTINNYENDLREKAKELGDEHMFDDALEISSSELNNAKEIIDNYGNQFKESLIAEITSDDDKAKTYTEALQAIEEYNEAVLKSENPYNYENVKCCIPGAELKTFQSVYVKVPMNDLKKMHICGVV